MYKTYDYKCEDCEETTIELFDKNDVPNMITCMKCFGVSIRAILSAPVVMRAGFADGFKRGDRWELTKEAGKLEQEAASMRKRKNHTEASKLKAEARVLAKRAGTKRDKTDK
jgi:predicted nucleic acid-binding Zn ribbon protein